MFDDYTKDSRDSESKVVSLLNGKSEKKGKKAAKAGRILTFGEILEEKCDPVEYVLNPWLIRQGIALVYADRGIGKTHFAFNVAHAIARGGKYLKWRAGRPYRVLYLDGEMQFALVKERSAMMAKMCGTKANDNLMMMTPDKYALPIPDLKTADGQAEVDEHINALKIDVVVIDNIATLMPSLKGNSNDEWHEFVQPWLLDLRRRNVSTIVVHHSGKFKKDEPSTSRGSTAKEDVADTVIRLYRPIGYLAEQGARFNVEFTKNRHFYGEDAKEFEAWLKQDELTGDYGWKFDEPEKPMIEKVCDLYREGMLQAEIAEKFNVTRQRVSKLIQEGIKKGKLPSGVYNNNPKGVG